MGDPQEGKGIDSMNVSYARGPVWGPHHRSVYRSHSTDGGTRRRSLLTSSFAFFGDFPHR